MWEAKRLYTKFAQFRNFLLSTVHEHSLCLFFFSLVHLSNKFYCILKMVTIIDPHIKREGGYHIHEAS